MLLKENRKLSNSKEFVFPFTVAVLLQLIFIRSENPRNEHVTCVGRYADIIRLIWGKNYFFWRPYLKAFSAFNVLETCRVYLLTIDLEIVKFTKKFIEWFLE